MACGVLATVVLASCSSSGSSSGGSKVASGWNAILSAANKEGSVTVYSGNSDAQNALLTKAFEKAYPKIKVNILRILTPAGEQRAQTEFQGHAKGADVIVNTDLKWHTAQAKVAGFSTPLVGPDDTSAAAKSGDAILNSNKTLLVTANPHGYGWNSSIVGNSFTLNDLTDPKYKGKIGLYDFCTSDPNTLEFYEDARLYGGTAFLTKLAANKPVFYSDSAPMVQAMSSGEIQAGIPIQYSVIGNAKQVKVGYPSTTVASPFYAMATGWATHPNAAQVYINWLVTKDGQTQWAAYDKVAVVATGVSGATLKASQLDIVDTSKFSTATIDSYRQMLEKMFNHKCPN